MKSKLFINGRFLAQGEVTGVQRVGLELMNSLDQKISNAGMPRPWKEIEILLPGDARRGMEYENFQLRMVGKSRGHIWEQVDLPWFTRGHALVSLGNLGPVLKACQSVLVHDAAVFSAPAGFTLRFRSWYRFVHRALALRIPLVLTVSEFSRKELSSVLRLQKRNILVIQNGVSHIHRVRERPSILERLDIRKPFVLAVASANPNKNLSILYDIAAPLADCGVGIVLVGSTNPSVFAQAPTVGPHDLENIQHIGRVTDEELKGLYKMAEAFVFPSLYEGFGLPPLEAMACGCPVVASNCASIPEVCGDGALYFDPRDADSLLKHIVDVIGDRDLRSKMIDAGGRTASLYTWGRAGDQFYAALETLGRRLASD